jgi:hypothetical protein
MPLPVDGVLVHDLSGTELSRVRTELQRRRRLTTASPHPVQAPHRYLGKGSDADASPSECTGVSLPLRWPSFLAMACS